MQTLLPQSREALAGQTQVLLVELQEVRPPVVQPSPSQQAPAWSRMQRPSWQSTVPAGHPQLPPRHCCWPEHVPQHSSGGKHWLLPTGHGLHWRPLAHGRPEVLQDEPSSSVGA